MVDSPADLEILGLLKMTACYCNFDLWRFHASLLFWKSILRLLYFAGVLRMQTIAEQRKGVTWKTTIHMVGQQLSTCNYMKNEKYN
jgi:hypothetical protein